MKKVGIVTFHRAHNYGAVLQAYALKKQLEKLGHSVKFYNYTPDWIIDHYLLFPKVKHENLLAKCKRYIGHRLDLERRTVRHEGFSSFISSHLNEWDNCELNELDCIVIGSDQVWNPNITGGFDEECFGYINKIDNVKVITYAASMETVDLNDKLTTEFLSLIKNVDSLGVREDSLKQYIESKDIDKNIHHNLDPTLLLSAVDWNILEDDLKNENPYLLIYENYKDVRTHDVAESIAKALGLEIKIITAAANWRDSKESKSSASPTEFLALFSNASFVVTTSYHGLAFSINYKIPFISLKVTNGVNNRAISLLNALGLSDYMVHSSEFDIKRYRDIEYSEVYQKLDRLRGDSMNYLKNAIEG
ncbi:polysaccharide pyruvyl transferase family protein [Photobacterium swingsii]|uniref:polysaccharide pyruvyl transferase family protein n=1 Tax=Photobacterium swingsii TaxID=680026 RepID=UPI00406764B0